MLMARFTAQNVFPSPGRELLTMTRLPGRLVAELSSNALRISGRLIIRNSSAINDRSECALTIPAAISAS